MNNRPIQAHIVAAAMAAIADSNKKGQNVNLSSKIARIEIKLG
ncbi:hypothetical protein [Neobacillus niacini]|nr:hypothetical protein [Neobacillus niacini]